MSSDYDFNAPQFVNFREIDKTVQGVCFDKFDTESEASLEATPTDDTTYRRVTFNVAMENDENSDPQGSKLRVHTPASKAIRGDIDPDDGLLEGIDKLDIDSNKKVKRSRTPLRTTQVFEGIELEPLSAKRHSMVTRQDALVRTPKLSLRTREILKPIEPDSPDDNDDSMVTAVSSTSLLGESSALKRRSFQMPTHSSIEDQPKKFVALAEQLIHFQKDTPDRYRTKPHQPWRPSIKPPLHYFPKSPSLSALHRNRTVYFPDREKREEMEYEEMRKHQVKAHPINEKILKQVSLGLKAPIEKRPSTRPEPFKLTEFKPKPVAEEEPLFQFKAQPVPRKILTSPCGIPPKMVRPVTTPKTPRITMPTRMRANTPGMESQCSGTSTESINRMTRVEPFSFETRDKMLLAKKEEQIKKFLDEEKKMFSSFKAQPVRAFKQTPLKGNAQPERRNTTVVPFNLTKPTEKKLPEVKPTPFQARPAAVLKQRPFYPTHAEMPQPKMLEFKLRTADRAQERQKYEEKMSKQEEEYKKALEEQRLEQERKDAESLKALRQLAEFKANPVPQFKPFKVRPSRIQLTDPQSPCFLSGKKNEQEK